jgi:hypothetical protein
LEPVAPWHQQITNHHFRLVLQRHSEAAFAVFGLNYVPPMRPEQFRKDRAERFIVVDQENRFHGPGGAEFFRSERKLKNLRAPVAMR